jgi:hypothetical protein
LKITLKKRKRKRIVKKNFKNSRIHAWYNYQPVCGKTERHKDKNTKTKTQRQKHGGKQHDFNLGNPKI